MPSANGTNCLIANRQLWHCALGTRHRFVWTSQVLQPNHNLQDRGQRLARIATDLQLADQARLVKAITLPPHCFNRVQTAAAAYVWHSLSQAYPRRAFELSTRVLEQYSDDILALPNRTPNGLLLARRETFLSFNLVQQALAAAIREMKLDRLFEAFQSPCNIRIVSGDASAMADSRPYASSKIHTDVWYGEPLRSILFNLPVLGNSSAVAMEFFEPDNFPVELQKPLADYNDGQKVSERAERLPMQFDIGVLYMSDSLSLHQTVRRKPGIRLSLDWRAIPRERLAGEVEGQIQSRASYVPTERFLEGGSTLVFTDGDPLDAFVRRSRGEQVDRARIETVPLDSA
jgi:hypothetical protein